MAAYDALLAGRPLGYIQYQHCSAAHLDQGEWAAKAHQVHTCASCRKNWRDSDVAGNPLAVWDPKVHGHQLKLGRTTAQVSTLVVEPSWLGAVAAGQRDPSDSEMVGIWAKARGQDSRFRVREVHGHELVYRVGFGDVL